MRNRKCVQLDALVCLFVVTIIFGLGMPSVADAAFGSAQQLRGTYIHSKQQKEEIPTDFFEFSNGSFTVYNHRNSDGLNGKYSITGDMIEFVYSTGIIEASKFSRTQNAIMFTDGSRTTTYVLASSERLAQIEAARERQKAQQIRRAEEERAREAEMARLAEKRRKEEEAFRAKFITVSNSGMSWSEAKSYCQQKGGRLPLINDMAKWDGKNPPSDNIAIDAFDAVDAPWPPGLPRTDYWTGTEYVDRPTRSGTSWYVSSVGREGRVGVADIYKHYGRRALCIPTKEARKAEEERRAEEVRRAEEARKFNQAPLVGFIVLSESLMTWNDAKSYCLQKGGRLPRINYSDSWDGDHPWDDSGKVFIDGFGAMARGGPWLADLPSEKSYWTGTEQSDILGVSWTVGDFFGEFVISNGGTQDSNLLRVLCVPAATPEARKAEEALRVEAVRKAEEGRKAEEARRAEAVRKAVETAKAEEEALRADGGRKLRELGFIALSESHMNWVEAKIFCRQKGGRLPRVNNSDLLASDIFGNHVDGFGSFGRPWGEIGLPESGYGYWTGTEVSDRPGHAWDVGGDQGTFCAVPNDPQDTRKRVACVPLAVSGKTKPAPAASEVAIPVAETATPAHTAPTPAQPSSYPPLAAADGKPKAAAHLVRLESDAVELALQVLAPGKNMDAIRIDNLGGVSSHWRSDGKDKAGPLAVSKGGTKLSSGVQSMNFSLGDTEALLSLSLKDNGAFAGKNTEFRVTVFFVDGDRALCILKV